MNTRVHAKGFLKRAWCSHHTAPAPRRETRKPKERHAAPKGTLVQLGSVGRTKNQEAGKLQGLIQTPQALGLRLKLLGRGTLNPKP